MINISDQDGGVFGDQENSHDINDMAPELPEAELYAAQSAAAEHDFQIFEQSRIISEHGYSLYPGKKYNKFAFNSENAIQISNHGMLKANQTSAINTRIAANVSDTDSGDQSTGGDFLISNSRRKRNKFGGLLANDSTQEEMNRMFPPFTPFAEDSAVVNEPHDDGFNSSSGSDSPTSLPAAIRNGFTNLTNGSAGGGGVSSEDNDFLATVVPSRMNNDESVLYFTEEKQENSNEEGIDTATLGGFKTMIGSDRKAIPSYFKKGGSFRDLTELGFNPNAKTIDLSKRTPKKKTPVSFNLSSPPKSAVRALFKSGPMKNSPVKKEKLKNDKSRSKRKNGKLTKPSPKTTKGAKRGKKSVSVSAKKLTSQQSKAVAAVRQRLNLSKKKKNNDVWCICRKPHGGRFMICCDKCNEWYHGSCVKVSLADGKLMAKTGEEYVCPKCIPKNPKAQKPKEKQKSPTTVRPVEIEKKPAMNESSQAPGTQTTKNRSAFSKMGLFDIGLPARKIVITKKSEMGTKPTESVSRLSQKKDSFALLLKKKRMERKSNVTLLKIARRSSTIPSKRSKSKSIGTKGTPKLTESIDQPTAVSRRSTRSVVDDPESLVKESGNALGETKTAVVEIKMEAKQPTPKLSSSKRKNTPRKRTAPVIEKMKSLEIKTKGDSESESPVSEKRVLRASVKPSTDSPSDGQEKVDEQKSPLNEQLIESTAGNDKESNPALKPQPGGGINKSKKRALLKATLIKNKSLLNEQLMQMKAAFGLNKDSKKEEEERKKGLKSSSSDVKDSRNRRKRPPDDDGNDSGNGSGGTNSSAGTGRASRGSNAERRSSSGSFGGKSPRNRSEKDQSSNSERRSSPRKRPDVPMVSNILIQSYELHAMLNTAYDSKSESVVNCSPAIEIFQQFDSNSEGNSIDHRQVADVQLAEISNEELKSLPRFHDQVQFSDSALRNLDFQFHIAAAIFEVAVTLKHALLSQLLPSIASIYCNYLSAETLIERSARSSNCTLKSS